jgi:solute:Na+ symporter, SSS family
MQPLDWFVLCLTQGFIIIFGIWKTRKTNTMDSFVGGERNLKWWTIGLSIMATQASGITFLSVPGQAYTDGLGFIQIYFGLPFAMIIISIFFLPKFFGLKVLTAYEYLEKRFDIKVRQLAALLFLIQRGLSAGITIYAPGIILSAIMGWDLMTTNLIIGALVIPYTVIGGSQAVSLTQQHQMIVIWSGLFFSFFIALQLLPTGIGLNEAMTVAGEMGRTKAIDFTFDPSSRYNLWSGLIGGIFLSLSYFGADQSQVQRYLGGDTQKQSRIGLVFNGLVKIPMQLFILTIGLLVFSFYQFREEPLHFNAVNVALVAKSDKASEYANLNEQYQANHRQQGDKLLQIIDIKSQENPDLATLTNARVELQQYKAASDTMRIQAKTIIKSVDAKRETKDADYIFLHFVLDFLPTGIVGLLLSVIFAAALSSTSAGLSALATSTLVDFYRRSWFPGRSDNHYFKAGRWLIVIWGVLVLLSILLFTLADNLIQAVNMVGSIFYGTILGIFLCALFVKYVQAKSVFIAGLITQATIFYIHFYCKVAYLWYNLLGALLVIALAVGIELLIRYLKSVDDKA